MFISKRTLLCALLTCPLVLSGSSTLRGDRRLVIETNKQPAENGDAPGPPVPAAEAAPAPAGPGPEAQSPPSPPPPSPPAEQNNPPPAPPAPEQTTQNNLSPPPAGPGPEQQQKPAPSGPEPMTKPTPDGANNQNNPPGPTTKPTPPDQATKPTPEDQLKPPTPTGDGNVPVTTLPGNVTTPPDGNTIVGCTRMAGNNTCITTGGGGLTNGTNNGQGQGQGQDQSQSQTTMINNNVNGGGGGSSGGGGWPVSSSPAPPPAPINAKCDLITPKASMASESSCGAALPTFVSVTSDMGWAQQTPDERESSLDTFCQTSCGQTYTETLMSRRRGCEPPTPKGDGMALVPNGPASFPSTYPGLRLGCVIDPQDGQYCALKKASPGDGDCAFYMSCCYGELAMTKDGNAPDRSFYNIIDKRCPGSAKYRTMTCV